MKVQNDEFKKALAAARKASPGEYLWEVEGYCQNTDCNIREVTVELKEFAGPTPPQFSCPVCGQELTVHHVYDAQKSEQERDREARESVNYQIYKREHSGWGPVPFRALA